jgi:DNA mismatch endonuclease (patch repair protein)
VTSRHRWRSHSPTDAAWRPRANLTRAERSAEQDCAAGGHEARVVEWPDGRIASASIELKALPKSRRLYAYLRFSADGRTRNRYVGEVGESTREANLMQAWRLAHEKGLLRWDVT